MMKTILKNIQMITFLFATVITLNSCHKEGTGGKASIHGLVKHHTKIIPNAIVYIKYGAKESPGTDVSKYDDKVTANGSAEYEFTGLYKGDYFLYGVGFDDQLMEQVSGGTGVEIKKRSEDVSADVPVTE